MDGQPAAAGSGKLRVMITGTTGMVGEGVMLACLAHPAVERVLSVSRKPCGTAHPKLRECIVPDFADLDGEQDRLRGCDACFFCAGVSSVGRNEAEYTRITYDMTLHFARTLVKLNPAMVFVYVSGAMTDSTETGRVMWARVKGRTENALLRCGFRAAYNFRPGLMTAMPGQKHVLPYYKWLAWMMPMVRFVLPNQVSSLHDVGEAMLRCALTGYPKPILEIRDINSLARSG